MACIWAPDDTIYLTDDGDHTVRKRALNGTVLLTIGIPGRPSGYMSGTPFHRCTHTAMSPNGDIYVGDVSNTFWPQFGRPLDPSRELRCLQKLKKLG